MFELHKAKTEEVKDIRTDFIIIYNGLNRRLKFDAHWTIEDFIRQNMSYYWYLYQEDTQKHKDIIEDYDVEERALERKSEVAELMVDWYAQYIEDNYF